MVTYIEEQKAFMSHAAFAEEKIFKTNTTMSSCKRSSTKQSWFKFH